MCVGIEWCAEQLRADEFVTSYARSTNYVSDVYFEPFLLIDVKIFKPDNVSTGELISASGYRFAG